jgi:probable F420-dependent oxidoreductase
MNFGVILPNYGAGSSLDEILRTAQFAEASNFDSIWTTDHILLPQNEAAQFGRLFEALSTLSYLAGQTSRIRLGVSSLVLPLRDPMLAAKQIAAIDVFSAGRMIVCVGAGWAEGEFSNLGKSFTNRGRRLDEGIEILRLLWGSKEDETVNFRGRYYQFSQAVFSPKPIQKNGPPIWVGGHSNAARKRAAHLADGWHPSSLSLEQFRHLSGKFLKLEQNRNPTLSVRIRLSFDGSDKRAQLQGSDAEVIETLSEFQSAGLQYPVITFSGSSTGERMKSLERFAENVLPLFADSQ